VSGREVIEAAAELSRTTWQARVARLRRLAPTLLMGAIAAGAAWYIATKLVGEQGAFFAPVAAIITLGLTVGSQLNRAIELSIGVPLGIALADVLVLHTGSGTIQLIGIVFLATAIAVFLGGGPLLVTQAAVSAILVVTLQPPTDGLSFTRAADALIGCGVALLLNFVIAPIDPMALVRREAAPVLDELAAVLDDIAGALIDRDRGRAIAALHRARDIDASTQRFLEALTIGRETAAAAPARRRRRGGASAARWRSTARPAARSTSRCATSASWRAACCERSRPATACRPRWPPRWVSCVRRCSRWRRGWRIRDGSTRSSSPPSRPRAMPAPCSSRPPTCR
jgi:uncharacterized membrane protein YccC